MLAHSLYLSGFASFVGQIQMINFKLSADGLVLALGEVSRLVQTRK